MMHIGRGRRRRAATVCRRGVRAGAVAAVALLLTPAVHGQSYDAERAAMVRALADHRAELTRLIGRAALSDRVLETMGMVPRHAFVPEAYRDYAYANRPLPIGHGQTISQPLMVALMTSVLAPKPEDVVLEIGTGSGYQAAVLAHLVKRVHTIEIVPELAETARARLARLGYDDIVEVRTGDGYKGWAEAAPFDAIIVTAAPEKIPPRLVEQLKPGGRMVLPLGAERSIQQLTLVEKAPDGTADIQSLLPVRFVPMVGGDN